MAAARAIRFARAGCVSAFLVVGLAYTAVAASGFKHVLANPAIRHLLQLPGQDLNSGGPASDETQWASFANTPQTTFAGCSCLNPWYASHGTPLAGGCRIGNDETQGLPWCFVNTTSCSLTPASQQSRRYLLLNQMLLDWDYCVPRNSTDITNAGCSCLPVWGYGGVTYLGACQNPDDDAAGAWCLIAPGSCSTQPAGQATAWHDGWDYCNSTASNSSSTSNPDAASNIRNDEQDSSSSLAAALLGDESAVPERTLSGCRCAQQWIFNGVPITGGQCDRPDQDPVGPWCRVDPRTCTRAPERSRMLLGAWDYCAIDTRVVRLPPHNTTRSGCQCKAKWTLYPPGGQENSPWQYGCQNPDGDPQGAWCVVDPSSCSQPAGVLASNDQAYDYCKPLSAQAAAPNPGTNSRHTVAGCQCLPTWNYTSTNGSVFNFTEGQCSAPDGDPGGPWCYVDAKTCNYQPFGRGSRSHRYWDYCEPPAALRSQSGCLCRNTWTYPGSNAPAALLLQVPRSTYYGTYANPDADPLGAWCIVQPQTCTRGLPFDQLGAEESSAVPPGTPDVVSLPEYYDYQGNTTQAAATQLPQAAQDLNQTINQLFGGGNAAASNSSGNSSGAPNVISTPGGLADVLGALLKPSDTLPLNTLNDTTGLGGSGTTTRGAGAGTTGSSTNGSTVSTSVLPHGGTGEARPGPVLPEDQEAADQPPAAGNVSAKARSQLDQGSGAQSSTPQAGNAASGSGVGSTGGASAAGTGTGAGAGTNAGNAKADDVPYRRM